MRLIYINRNTRGVLRRSNISSHGKSNEFTQIELIAAGSPRRREDLERRIAEAEKA
ncbi:MAG TPA: hypothetical protein VJV39_12085 [Dongiaceae bacterium]|nr:hypothetical protein [Dongiaceae bacterium]